MTTAVTSTAPNVHIEIPGAQALSEFQGFNDDCGPNAELMALHLCPWDASPLTANGLDSFRWQYVQANRWSNGTTLADILWHLVTTRHAHLVPGALPYSATPNLDALHTYIHACALAQNPVIIQVANAAALAHNESGVHSHFVTLAGVDTVAGYLTLNGDVTDALGGAHLLIPSYWNTWQTLVNAQICGAIGLQRIVTAPPPPPAPTPGQLASQATALLAQASALLAQIH